MGVRPAVILSHAGVQYSYQVALALQEAGFLKAFWTTLYGIGNRRCKGLKSEFIHSFPWPEIFHKLAILLFGKNRTTSNELLYQRNRWFDHCVAKQLGKTSFDYFIGYAGSCLNSIREAKKLGRLALVDQHDIHPTVAERLLREEIELHPDFAPLIPGWPPHRKYLEYVVEELHLADQILVPSNFSLETHRLAGIPKDKLVHIPLGVDLPTDFSDTRGDDKVFRILFVGTISQRKGIKYLLEAVKGLRLPKCELVLIGQIGGDAKPLRPYRDFFKHEGFLSGHRLNAYWNSSHVLVLPSLYDALGLVVPEAMAHGMPVIVSENTGGQEMIREGVDGFVVPTRDVRALKERLTKLYENRSLCEEMGRNAKERAREFTWARYREKITAYLGTIGGEQS